MMSKTQRASMRYQFATATRTACWVNDTNADDEVLRIRIGIFELILLLLEMR